MNPVIFILRHIGAGRSPSVGAATGACPPTPMLPQRRRNAETRVRKRRLRCA